ncbi:zinc finger protein ubi-d4-like isoform X3 [Oratosquilla oratoria]|uniref:zinc finger protein ubi-d4-like isoform X3 n=1 Tax=Oratosquilla oratoria TaxID=337810 RepID=UPI003F75ACDB
MAVAAVENPALDKIMSFVNDTGYKELMESSAKFNVRIRKDRITRQPYIDGQTGVAQRHCHLFVSDKQRMPGILQGQVYTYPARRWKAPYRSYLASFMQAAKTDPDEHTITTVENPAAVVVVEEPPPPPPPEKPKKEEKPEPTWAYYEDNGFEDEILEEDFESEDDLDDETYSRKGSKRKKAQGKKAKLPSDRVPATYTKKSKKKSGEGGDSPRPASAKKKSQPKTPSKSSRSSKKIKEEPDDESGKPYSCELCGMRYKTRPGLTYHYAHSHKEEKEKEAKAKPNVLPNDPIPSNMPHHPPAQPVQFECPQGRTSGRRSGGQSTTKSPSVPPVETAEEKNAKKKKAPANPYCDFCLGDSTMNKKTGMPEDLVSCADCGRSGHPTCLQFTQNMMKSINTYRWQCIECKTCTLCGTSENDDQLLFCDDCDRGFHLYCLTPPLSEPPEGEWSCYLCLQEFHGK